MSLGNSYAGMRIMGRSDSWYEPDDDSAFEKACEFVATWIDENTTIPDSSIDNDMVDPIALEYLDDPECLTDGLAEDLQAAWNEYCETNHELGKPR
jgi:hypothetical protein